jgi:hypothetical protein
VGGEVLVTASASSAAASATLASLIAGQHGGAAELIEPSMDAYESPGFTMLAMEAWTTEQHTGSEDTHVELSMIILRTSDTFTMNCTIRIAGTKGIRMDESEYLDRMGSEKNHYRNRA